MKTIQYKGKTLETIHWKPMSDELHGQLKEEFYKNLSLHLFKKK